MLVSRIRRLNVLFPRVSGLTLVLVYVRKMERHATLHFSCVNEAEFEPRGHAFENIHTCDPRGCSPFRMSFF
jgi:hypothetical protein